MEDIDYKEIFFKIISKEQIFEHILPLIGYLLTAYTINKLSFGRNLKTVILCLSIFPQAILWSGWRLKELNEGPNLFEDLQLKRNFDTLDIKRKSKEVFKQFHPDRHSAEDKDEYSLIFSRKKAALDFLSNPIKRELYDKFNLNMMNDTRDNE